jgi:hypothetical protein
VAVRSGLIHSIRCGVFKNSFYLYVSCICETSEASCGNLIKVEEIASPDFVGIAMTEKSTILIVSKESAFFKT